MIKKFLEKLVQYSFLLNKQTQNKQRYLKIPSSRCTSFLNPYQESKRKSSGRRMDSTLSTEHDDDEVRSRACKICSDHLGGAWSKISPCEMSFIPISGGMSNSLFCCSLPESAMISDGEPVQVLLRLYGDQSRNCDMSIQLEIFNLLSLKGLGPKLFGDFEDGRLEEYLPANSLTCEELMDHDISSIIAKKLATVHSLDVPIDKKNTWLMERFDEWVESIKEQGETSNFNEETRKSTIEIARGLLAINFNEEIKFLRGILDRTRSPTVFSHNDLHQGNILLAKYSKRRPTLEERIVFIDFEYCSYNYRAYDIANHFCEWCFQYDTPDYPHFMFFEDRFPSKDNQRDFVHSYSDQNKKLSVSLMSSPPSVGNNGLSNKNNHCDNNGSTSTNCNHINGHSNGTSNGTEEDTLLNEVKPFLMAANLLWTLWCIKSAQSSTIKFGYWEHAMARWRLYSSFKASCIKEMKTQTNGNSIGWK